MRFGRTASDASPRDALLMQSRDHLGDLRVQSGSSGKGTETLSQARCSAPAARRDLAVGAVVINTSSISSVMTGVSLASAFADEAVEVFAAILPAVQIEDRPIVRVENKVASVDRSCSRLSRVAGSSTPSRTGS